MTSNRSFFDPRLLRETLRRNIWAFALSMVGFFFCLPLPAAMTIQNRLSNVGEAWTRADALDSAGRNLYALMTVDNIFVKLGMCIMAVLCGIALFRYLHSRKQVDFYHGIPVRRSALFANNYAAGVVAVLPAFLIMYALTAIIGAVMGVPFDASGSEIVQALLTHILFFLLIYTVSVLATVLTGNTIIAVLLDVWLLFSLPFLAAIAQALGQQYLETWLGSSLLSWIGYHTSPVILYFVICGNDFGFLGPYYSEGLASTAPVLVGVLAVTLVLLALSLVLFRRRRSERAGVAVAFRGLQPPLKCYMVLMIAFVFGIIFGLIGGEFWVWFGLLAGTALGHILIEMIYHFDFRAAFAHWKTMIVLAVAAVLIMVGVQNDVMGYDRWVPDEGAVQAAGFRTGLAYRYGSSTGLWDAAYDYGNDEGSGLLTDPECIAAILKLAEIGVDSRADGTGPAKYSDDTTEWSYISIFYELSGGRRASRSYDIPVNDEVWAQMDAIRFNTEYIKEYNPLFRDIEHVKRTTIVARTNAEPSASAGTVVSDSAATQEIFDTLREETLTLTPEIVKTTIPVLRLDIERVYARDKYEDGISTIEYVAVYPSFTRTLALLKAQGIEPEPLTADALSHITVYWDAEKYAEQAGEAAYAWETAGTEAVDHEGKQVRHLGDGLAVITDKAQMQALLENAVLEPVSCSCDISMRFFSSADEKGNVGDYGLYTIVAAFPNNFTCTLYYPEGKFPLELCQMYRSSANP